ncbi:TPA: DUF6900 domain-containing protein [Burkholderia ambifaria]
MIREELELLDAIACEHLLILNLQERKADRLDVHSVVVWNVRAALAAAYETVRNIGRKPRN